MEHRVIVRGTADNTTSAAAPASAADRRRKRRKKSSSSSSVGAPDVRLSVLLLAALFAVPAALGTALLTADAPEERFPAAGSLEVGRGVPEEPALEPGAGAEVGGERRGEEGATSVAP